MAINVQTTITERKLKNTMILRQVCIICHQIYTLNLKYVCVHSDLTQVLRILKYLKCLHELCITAAAVDKRPNQRDKQH